MDRRVNLVHTDDIVAVTCALIDATLQRHEAMHGVQEVIVSAGTAVWRDVASEFAPEVHERGDVRGLVSMHVVLHAADVAVQHVTDQQLSLIITEALSDACRCCRSRSPQGPCRARL